ncbi:hypothetical protein PR048_014504 [Dryococelus australis]|uniref:LIM zinc-binding domain-containing protein n=1 Tax=Dryococelus australis TaxID=614101 RepID=A0ABQ9HEE7_9NEOP|nr:hypothetical protein PR048_014504 [Dryococelus australis]
MYCSNKREAELTSSQIIDSTEHTKRRKLDCKASKPLGVSSGEGEGARYQQASQLASRRRDVECTRWPRGRCDGCVSRYNTAAMYRMNLYESTCLRCCQTVYQVDRVGPLKDFTFFHSGCFKCAVCGTKLTLKTYYNNQHRQEDKDVYCSSHVPKIGPGHLDGSAVGIRSALNVPRSANVVNEQIRGGGGKGTFDAEALNIRPHLNGHYTQAQQDAAYQYGRFDASALHIAHALRATEIQRAYNKVREKPIDYYLVSSSRLDVGRRYCGG